MDFLKEAKSLQDELVKVRRKIHQCPELNMDLPKTTALVMEKLEEMGIKAERIIDSGISATIGDPNKGKTILLRQDMDGLPIQEPGNLEFKSKNDGLMHACGHDMHTTMLLGAAKLLKDHEDELDGCVKLMFQPGEETFSGSRKMIEAGILENPKVNMALDMHVFSNGDVGVLNYAKGPFTTSADNFKISIKGFGGHGSKPEVSIDSLNIAVQIYQSLEAMIAREFSANDYIAMSICSINSGDSYNILPDSVELRGTLRTYKPAIRDKAVARIKEISENVTKAFRAESAFEIVTGAPAIISDEKMVDKVSEYLKELDYDFKRDPNFRMPASDDFGYIASQVPSVMFAIGCRPEGVTNNFVHNPNVVFDESILHLGATVFAHCAYNFLKDSKE